MIDKPFMLLFNTLTNANTDFSITSAENLYGAFCAFDRLELNSEQQLPITNQFSGTALALSTFRHNNILRNSYFQSDWILIIFIVCIGIYGFIRNTYLPQFQKLVKSFTSIHILEKYYKDSNPRIFSFNTLLNINFYLTFSFFILYSLKYFDINSFLPSVPQEFFLIVAVLLLFFFIKQILYKAVGIILNIKDTIKLYIFNINQICRISGLIFIPFLLILPFIGSGFVSIFYVIATITGLIFLIMRIYKSILILVKKEFQIFYMILYLCTLEILPYGLLYNYVTSELLK